MTEPAEVVARLTKAGVGRGDLVGLAVGPAGCLGLAARDQCWPVSGRAAEVVAEIEAALRPRWVWWSARSAAAGLVGVGVRVATCWDLAAVHRLLAGGNDDDPALVWAALHRLDPSSVPRLGQLDLLGPGTDHPPGDPEDPVGPDGHLRAEWTDGSWARTPDRLARWAALALRAQSQQAQALSRLDVSGDPVATAHAESAAELLCVELAHDGLPLDVTVAEQILAALAGPRPRSAMHEAELRRTRDDQVRRHLASTDARFDLRNPAHVRTALAAVGIDLPDTRSWRLEPWRGQHPLVDALLAWRKADRLTTTYGYGWLDRHVGADGRLRGAWSGSDGAAGRMTAQAGLHNLPAELRPAVVAEPGQVFVRADLGQVEPRVLAAVSDDAALAAATTADDLYLPVARRLGVERPVAKVAVLAAMYGQTSGTAGQALAGLEAAYPVAMGFLRAAYEDGRAGRAVRTHGGRLVRMHPVSSAGDEQAHRSAVNGRGRFARNAMVQGAAAELFKAWAVTVRAGLRAGPRTQGARIVLCLHDELLVQVPHEGARDVQALLHQGLQDISAHWHARFVAEVSTVQRWSEAK